VARWVLDRLTVTGLGCLMVVLAAAALAITATV
jgi:hypothetical protein